MKNPLRFFDIDECVQWRKRDFAIFYALYLAFLVGTALAVSP